MKMYMEISQDEYELPLAVADTIEELAEICGVKAVSVRATIWRRKHGQRKRTKYIEIEMEEDT